MPKIGQTVSKPAGVSKKTTAKAPVKAPPKVVKKITDKMAKATPRPLVPVPPKPLPKATKPPVKVVVQKRNVLELLATAADREAMYAQDVIRFPAILERHKLSPEEVTHTMAQQADRLNRELNDQLLAQWNGAKVV